ncbi:putative Histone-lysine N-methyltransferase SET9 [Seiridium cardinale]
MPPATATVAKKQPLTLDQISKYDDILTDCLVDQTFYSSTIPKNRTTYHPSRGLKEEEITKIIQQHLIVEPDLDLAVEKLLALDGLRKFHNGLRTAKEKDDFRKHLRRYAQIYLPDCPFEVSTTNRYTIVTYEAAVTARRFIKRGESVKYLSGIQVLITAKEEDEMTKRKKDFSIVVSSRNKCASLFMGPARFANHDCDANARLVITSQSTIEIFATKNIEVGDEITVTYGENYFGEDNCECLCHTCETNLANGWAQSEGEAPEPGLVKTSIEDTLEEGYRLRRRRRDDSTARSSRTPSRTPDVRHRVSRSRTKLLKEDSRRASLTRSPAPEARLRQMRKREFEMLSSPPVTPAKRQKSMQFDDAPISAPEEITRKSNDGEASGLESVGSASESNSGESPMTDVTTPDEEMREPELPELSLQSPNPTPKKSIFPELKLEESDFVLSGVQASASQERTRSDPVPGLEGAPPAKGIPAAVIPDMRTCVEIIPPEDLNLVIIPPPLTPAAGTTESVHVAFTPGPADRQPADEPIKRGRGRPKGSTKAKKLADRAAAKAIVQTTVVQQPQAPRGARSHSPESISDDGTSTTKSVRKPGDYTLTPLLLPESQSAWNWCRVCDDPFVQHDAYFTRAYCPRCERHSKLYGYQWPKTQKEGKKDKEERVLDHREIHRFLDPEEEARVRGRKYLGAIVGEPAEEAKKTPNKSTPKPLRRKRSSAAARESDGEYKESEEREEEETESARRSARKRTVSLKA